MKLNRKCLPLKDTKSLRALNAFYALLIGLKMLPQHAHFTLEEFVKLVEQMEPEDQVTIFVTGAKFVELQPEEIKAMVCFCTDKNGVPYTSENVKNLGPSEFIEVIATVCMEIVRNIHIDLITNDEKKNLSPTQLTSGELF